MIFYTWLIVAILWIVAVVMAAGFSNERDPCDDPFDLIVAAIFFGVGGGLLWPAVLIVAVIAGMCWLPYWIGKKLGKRFNGKAV